MVALLVVSSAVLQATSTAEASSKEYYLYIRCLDYPREVLINSTFQVSVLVDYSLPAISQYSVQPSTWLVAARLYNSTSDTSSSDELLATSKVDEISGVGSKLFIIKVSAPSSETTMNLGVFSMYKSSYSHLRDGSWLYTHEFGSRVNIRITVSATGRLYLTTNDIPIAVTIDGFQDHETDEIGHLEVRLGGLRWHTIEVPGEIDLGPGMRAVLISWDDGPGSPLRQVYIGTMNTTLAATYRRQFYLRVSDNGGSGWYDAGSYANVTARQEERAKGLLGMIGFVRVFKEWSGDLRTKDRSAKVLVDRPREIQANWEIQYRPTLARAAMGAVLFGAVLAVFLLRGRLMRAIRQVRRKPADGTDASKGMKGSHMSGQFR